MDEYDSFKNVFLSINHILRKISNSKIIHSIKKHFAPEHHFHP